MRKRERAKAVIVLDALVRGRRVVLAGRLCVLDGNRLYIVATRWNPQTGENGECFLPLDLSLADFLDACERLPEDEVAILMEGEC